MYEKQPRKRLSIKQWDLADRPREKMMMFGRTSLSNAELLAIIIGSGNANLSAVDLAKQILGSVGNNLHELSKLSYKDYCNRFKGIGPAKALNIIAALELGFRRKETAMLERQQIISSYDAYTHVAQFLLDLDYEAFYVIFLDIGNATAEELAAFDALPQKNRLYVRHAAGEHGGRDWFEAVRGSLSRRGYDAFPLIAFLNDPAAFAAPGAVGGPPGDRAAAGQLSGD